MVCYHPYGIVVICTSLPTILRTKLEYDGWMVRLLPNRGKTTFHSGLIIYIAEIYIIRPEWNVMEFYNSPVTVVVPLLDNCLLIRNRLAVRWTVNSSKRAWTHKFYLHFVERLLMFITFRTWIINFWQHFSLLTNAKY